MSRINDYLEFLKAHGRTEKTIKDYRLKLSQAEKALEAGGYSTDPTETDGDAFLYLRRAIPGKEETVRQIMKAWDRLVEWTTGRKILPTLGLLWNRKQVRRTFISPEQYAGMMKAARDPFERVLLVLGGMMGCRRIEMIRLRIEDVGENTVTIRGKGHQDGLIIPQPINGTVREELRAYMAWRATLPGSEHDPRLLILPRRYGGFLSESTMEYTVPRKIKSLARRAGVDASTHTLRRLFGTTIYSATDHDLAATARLLRHADIATTVECYIEPSRNRDTQTLDTLCDMLTF